MFSPKKYITDRCIKLDTFKLTDLGLKQVEPFEAHSTYHNEKMQGPRAHLERPKGVYPLLPPKKHSNLFLYLQKKCREGSERERKKMSTLLKATILLRNLPEPMILTMKMASSSVRSLFRFPQPFLYNFPTVFLIFVSLSYCFLIVCGVPFFQISKNRRVSVRSFGGKIIVDIREFYVKDGKQMPGRKGRCCQLFSFSFCCQF